MAAAAATTTTMATGGSDALGALGSTAVALVGEGLLHAMVLCVVVFLVATAACSFVFAAVDVVRTAQHCILALGAMHADVAALGSRVAALEADAPTATPTLPHATSNAQRTAEGAAAQS